MDSKANVAEHGVMFFVVCVLLLVLWAVWRTVVLVRADGLGSRPAPRSHAEQTLGSTWPQQDEWNR